MYQETEKYKEYLSKFQDLRSIIAGAMCKGVNPETIAKATLAHMENKLPPDLHTLVYAALGKTVVFPEVDLWNDTSDDYAKKMVDSGNWEQITLDDTVLQAQIKRPRDQGHP